jgi:branched-chain amino acid transport system substrate-binding protein
MKSLFRLLQVFLISLSLLPLIWENAAGQNSNAVDGYIRIGLLIPDSNSVAARNGAEIAIMEANEKGGFRGVPFELRVKYLDGPWGTGSKQAVSLIFDDNVWVLLGSNDGRSAHIVEQTATKSRVVMISCWAGDPTLSQAFVPWFFNCVPNDNQQAEILVDEIYKKPSFLRAAVVSDNNYDSRSLLNCFLQKVRISGNAEPVQLSWETYGKNPAAIAEKLAGTGVNAVVIFCSPKTSLSIIRSINQRKMPVSLFGPLSISNENELTGKEIRECIDRVSIPFKTLNQARFEFFREKYLKSFRNNPGMVAISAYEGMSIIIDAIRNAPGPDREKMQSYLKKINYEGITGRISFDERGNRVSDFHLVRIKDGIPDGSSFKQITATTEK